MLKIRLGEHDIRSTSEASHKHVDLFPKRIIVHGGYDAELMENDIALVVLEREVPLRQGIGIACLPGPHVRLGGKEALVAGWGATSSGS